MVTEAKPSPRWIRNFFFWSGIIATFAYRVIVILNNYSKAWAQTAWYIGTVGFVIYFLHRYQVSGKRARLIKEHNLIAKLASNPDLDAGDREAASYIYKTLLSTKEKWNYIFIFFMSVVAFIIGIYLDFFTQ